MTLRSGVAHDELNPSPSSYFSQNGGCPIFRHFERESATEFEKLQPLAAARRSVRAFHVFDTEPTGMQLTVDSDAFGCRMTVGTIVIEGAYLAMALAGGGRRGVVEPGC